MLKPRPLPPSRQRTTFDPIPLFNDPLADLRRAPRLKDNTVRIGGRTYVEYDNGQANVLVPQVVASAAPRYPTATAERMANRAAFMATHPLGAGAYGVASLFNAPQGVRDTALITGSVLDTILLGGAPSAMRRSGPRPPFPGHTPLAQRREPTRYRPADAEGRPTGLDATIEPSMLGTGTPVDRRIKPAGWQNDAEGANEGRGHLLANRFGGPGDEALNLVTLNQTKTNASKMKKVENRIARMVKDGEVVEYVIDVGYRTPGDRPSSLAINAVGSRGSEARSIFDNPKGGGKK